MTQGNCDTLDGLASLLDAINCGALLVDRAGRIAYANHRLCNMIGLDPPAVVGRTVDSFYDDPEAKSFLAARLADFDVAYEGEFYLPRADGGRMSVILSGKPIAARSSEQNLRLLTVIDISAQKLAEERLKEENASIAQLSDVVIEQAIELKRYSERLEERVQARTKELHEANMEAIYMLAVASEAKDTDTGAHVRRIEHLTRAIARSMGLSYAEAEQMGYSAILHDVGKMLVPDRILKKPGPLDPLERHEMEEHAAAGERILSRKQFFETARQIARSHHENWDGSGYPDRLAGADIPLAARIVHLADVYDALTSPRVYKEPWPHEQAARFIEENSGRHFDPDVVRAFKSLVDSGTFRPLRT